jgi:hypothetical protein
VKKGANELNGAFSKEEVQMPKKKKGKCSPSLAIKEMQSKTTLRFLFTPVRMIAIKNINHKILASMWGKRNPHTLLL